MLNPCYACCTPAMHAEPLLCMLYPCYACWTPAMHTCTLAMHGYCIVCCIAEQTPCIAEQTWCIAALILCIAELTWCIARQTWCIAALTWCIAEQIYVYFSSLKFKIDHYYIHNTFIAEGIVCKPCEYNYSSAIDYSGGKGLINVELIL